MAQAAPLGLSVYQLMEEMEPKTEAAKYMFLQDGRQISVSELKHFPQFYQQDAAPVHIENHHLKLSISTATGLLEVRSQTAALWLCCEFLHLGMTLKCSENASCLQKMRLKEDDSEHLMKVEFVWYGTTSNKDKSGAYLFLPDKEATVKTIFILIYSFF